MKTIAKDKKANIALPNSFYLKGFVFDSCHSNSGVRSKVKAPNEAAEAAATHQ
jgi:hypothetical protein